MFKHSVQDRSSTSGLVSLLTEPEHAAWVRRTYPYDGHPATGYVNAFSGAERGINSTVFCLFRGQGVSVHGVFATIQRIDYHAQTAEIKSAYNIRSDVPL